MLEMLKLSCLSFKISTQNLVLSMSYCLQHTTCQILLLAVHAVWCYVCYSNLSDCIRIESTDENFSTHKK